MKIAGEEINYSGVKFLVSNEDEKIGRAYLYILHNELHIEPFGFIEDVFIDEKYRGQGIGTKLVEEILQEAKKKRCYKVVMNSRYMNTKVHRLYEKLGFKDHDKEFRCDLI